MPSVEMCGDSTAQAVAYLVRLEQLTQPDAVGATEA
jgi:hypothetical protein